MMAVHGAVLPDPESIPVSGRSTLTLVPVQCCICGADDADPIAVGEDFEYRSTPDSFLAMQCRRCGLVYLNPRPSLADLPRIYPPNYHAFDFSAERFGLPYKVRRWLEARRLVKSCAGLAAAAKIIDVGCGDGFHLQLLRDFGRPGWTIEGVDASERAVQAARRAGVTVHQGRVEDLALPQGRYDLAFLIATIEHVDDPVGLLRAVRLLLRPGGRAVIVTDSTDSPDFTLFKGRHWGGYHFPRHWNLFNRRTLKALADQVELDVVSIESVVSPVNWVYSIRNLLDDWGAPRWLVDRFSLSSPVSLAVFTAFDALWCPAGRSALLRATLRRPQ